MVEVFQLLSPQGRSRISFYFVDDECVKVYDVAYRVSYGLFCFEVVFQLEQMMADDEFDELVGERFASLKPQRVESFQVYSQSLDLLVVFPKESVPTHRYKIGEE